MVLLTGNVRIFVGYVCEYRQKEKKTLETDFTSEF